MLAWHIPTGVSRIPHGFVDSAEAARRLGLTSASLKQYRSIGKGPRFLLLDRWRPIYTITDLNDYIEAEARKLEIAAAEKRARANAGGAP